VRGASQRKTMAAAGSSSGGRSVRFFQKEQLSPRSNRIAISVFPTYPARSHCRTPMLAIVPPGRVQRRGHFRGTDTENGYIPLPLHRLGGALKSRGSPPWPVIAP